MVVAALCFFLFRLRGGRFWSFVGVLKLSSVAAEVAETEGEGEEEEALGTLGPPDVVGPFGAMTGGVTSCFPLGLEGILEDGVFEAAKGLNPLGGIGIMADCGGRGNCGIAMGVVVV